MTETTIRLGDTGRVFATRHMGQWFREQIEALPPDESVMLDWTGVEVITTAFGDELAGKLAVSDQDREIRSAGMCPEVAETLDLVCKRRGLPCPDCSGAGVVYAGAQIFGGEPCPRGCALPIPLLDPGAPF
jgi:hypothetical protein